MLSKERMLDVLRFAHQQEIAFIDRLSEAERADPGAAGRWSAKDVIAHLAVWKGRLLDRLQGAPRDERPDDAINAEIYQAHHAKSWAEVRAMAEEASRRTQEYVRAASLEDLTREDKLPDGNSRVAWMAIMAESVSHAMAHLWDFHLQQGQPERAITLQEATAAQLRELDDPNVAAYGVYNLACVYARAGRIQDAIRALAEALRLRPQLTEWSKQDPDLAALRGEPGYQALYT